LDCDAIYGPWTDWVPDDGSTSACGVGTTNGVADSELQLTADQVAVVNTIIGIAKTENLDKAGAIIGIMAGLTESNLHIYANSNVPLSLNNPNKQAVGSDHDSLGIFQQRISTGWSTISNDPNNQQAVNQLMDPAYNTEAFFGSPPGSNAPPALSKGLQNVPNWQSMDPWMATQTFQVSAYSDGSNYKQHYSQAQSIVSKYYDSATAVALPVSFTGAGSGSSSGAATVCAGGVVAGNIVKTALGLAWPNGGHGKEQADATPAYQTAMPKAQGGDPGNDAWSDCGVFVATVMISSGADPNYVKRTTGDQMAYMQSHPELYQPINATSSAQLQPGDIFVDSVHTFIYVGPQPGGNDVTEASWHDHVPQLDNQVYFNDSGETFSVFRPINGG